MDPTNAANDKKSDATVIAATVDTDATVADDKKADDKKANALTFKTFENFEQLLEDENARPCYTIYDDALNLTEKVQELVDVNWMQNGDTNIEKDYWKLPTYRNGRRDIRDWNVKFGERGWQGKITYCLAIVIQQEHKHQPKGWLTINCLCLGSNDAMAQCKEGCSDPWMKTVRALNELKKAGIEPASREERRKCEMYRLAEWKKKQDEKWRQDERRRLVDPK